MIQCPQCERKLSEHVEHCPSCGAHFSKLIKDPEEHGFHYIVVNPLEVPTDC